MTTLHLILGLVVFFMLLHYRFIYLRISSSKETTPVLFYNLISLVGTVIAVLV